MKNKVLFIVLLSFAIPGMVQAQSGYASIQYVIGFGTGDLGSFISKASFRGAVFEYQRNINPNLSAGLEIGWNTFYEKKDYDTYTQETVSVSGLQYRYSSQDKCRPRYKHANSTILGMTHKRALKVK